MEMEPKKLICKDCGEEFEVTAGEVDWYTSRGWEIPKRCKSCREAAKAKRQSKNKEKNKEDKA